MNTPREYCISSLTSEEHKKVKKHKLEVNLIRAVIGIQVKYPNLQSYCFHSAVIISGDSHTLYLFKINGHVIILLLDMHWNISGLPRLSSTVLIYAYLIGQLQPGSWTNFCYETQITRQQQSLHNSFLKLSTIKN